MKLTLIAAMDQQGLIGKDNQLPWHIPADLKFFKQQTMGKPILMGRKTCESLPFPLPGRRNLVLTRNETFTAEGFETFQDITAVNEKDVMVIGGSTIYELLLPRASHLILTRIHHTFAGDTYFPDVDWTDWQLTRQTRVPVGDDNPNYELSFEFYDRINPVPDAVPCF
jgi:dihydrofolate reductase